MRRLTRGRAATDDESTPPASGGSDPVGDAATSETTAPPATGEDARADSEAATIVVPPGTDAAEADSVDRDLPAGVDAAELAAAPAGSAHRGRLRRRLRYLRHARELLLRDLGGFYYEAHRAEGGAAAHGRLLEVKARRLAVLDAEVRELEERLAEEHPQAVLREPGIGGTCPHCGELHGSDARFCPRCGAPLGRRPAWPSDRPTGASSVPTPTPAIAEQGRPTTASLWGRRRSPAAAEPAPEATQQSAGESAGSGESPTEHEPPTGTESAATGEPPAQHEPPTGAESPGAEAPNAGADAPDGSVPAAGPTPERGS
jgi:hypothetical protein